jgi:hypothetical protein
MNEPFHEEDIARLNGALRSGMRFSVRSAPPRGPGSPGLDARLRLPGVSEPFGAHPSTVVGVLMCGSLAGRCLSAAFPVDRTVAGRACLHSLAGSLAECAMSLGLGAGIFRRAPGDRGILAAASALSPRESP